MKRALLILAASLALGGCFHHTAVHGTGGQPELYEPDEDYWMDHWIVGIIGDEAVDVRRVCPSGNATVKTKVSFINGLIGVFIGVIYFPTTVEVYCDHRGPGDPRSGPPQYVPPSAAPQSRLIELTPEQLKRIAKTQEALAWVRRVAPERAEELARAQRLSGDE